MKKDRLTKENRLLIEQLLKLNYKLKVIAEIIDVESSTISREIKKRRISGGGTSNECEKNKRFPFVCNGCIDRVRCKNKKYYYNYIRAHKHYEYLLKSSRIGIDMSIDEIDYWNDYLNDKIKRKNQPITHLFYNIKDEFPKTLQTFYSYIHKGYFTSINDEMLARSYSYKPRKRTNEKPTVRFDNIIRTGRKLTDMTNYLNNKPNASVVEMDTVIGKFEDKKCILTLYFRDSKLMLLFLIDKYKPVSVSKVFDKLKKNLGNEIFKELFEIILTDNGWEFSKPEDLEVDSKSSEKITNIFYCDPYSSWQKGGIERNHEFIRYIIPKGITFDNLTEKNIMDMMNNINSVSRRSLNHETPYSIFDNKYGNKITKKLHLLPIKKDEVDMSYRLLIK